MSWTCHLTIMTVYICILAIRMTLPLWNSFGIDFYMWKHFRNWKIKRFYTSSLITERQRGKKNEWKNIFFNSCKFWNQQVKLVLNKIVLGMTQITSDENIIQMQKHFKKGKNMVLFFRLTSWCDMSLWSL